MIFPMQIAPVWNLDVVELWMAWRLSRLQGPAIRAGRVYCGAATVTSAGRSTRSAIR
jgi:hypothetical protein